VVITRSRSMTLLAWWGAGADGTAPALVRWDNPDRTGTPGGVAGRAEDSDGLPGANVRFIRNVHLSPETPKWHEIV
jgi:hypothetical protein